MTWSNLRFNVRTSFVTMATNLPFCFFIQFLEQLLKFLVKFTLLKYVKSQKRADFWLNLIVHFSASLSTVISFVYEDRWWFDESMSVLFCMENNSFIPSPH